MRRCARKARLRHTRFPRCSPPSPDRSLNATPACRSRADFCGRRLGHRLPVPEISDGSCGPAPVHRRAWRRGGARASSSGYLRAASLERHPGGRVVADCDPRRRSVLSWWMASAGRHQDRNRDEHELPDCSLRGRNAVRGLGRHRQGAVMDGVGCGALVGARHLVARRRHACGVLQGRYAGGPLGHLLGGARRHYRQGRALRSADWLHGRAVCGGGHPGCGGCSNVRKR